MKRLDGGPPTASKDTSQSADLRSAYTVARDALWDCYQLTGADVSGDVGRSVTAWASCAVMEVAGQRAELDLALDVLQDIYDAGIEHHGLRVRAWSALNFDPAPSAAAAGGEAVGHQENSVPVTEEGSG